MASGLARAKAAREDVEWWAHPQDRFSEAFVLNSSADFNYGTFVHSDIFTSGGGDLLSPAASCNPDLTCPVTLPHPSSFEGHALGWTSASQFTYNFPSVYLHSPLGKPWAQQSISCICHCVFRLSRAGFQGGMGTVVCKRPTPFAHCCLNGGNFFSVGDSLTNQGIARKNTVEEKK